jgi:GNAT superfamily N-acetyltransferase
MDRQPREQEENAPPRSLAAAIEELLLVPAYASRWAPASIAAHRGLAFPLQLLGQVHRWTVQLGDGTVHVAGVGRQKLIEPLCYRLFGELARPSHEDRRALWNPAALVKTDADLVVAEVHRWMAPRFRRSGWLIVPEAVRWQGTLTEVPPAAPSRSLFEDLRKVRQHGFTLTQTTAPEDWEQFYHEMVRPQAMARHGESAWLPSRRLMAEFARTGTLHMISRGGVRVAGACSLGSGDNLWLPLSGIRHGDPALLRQGAGTAALALTLEWARRQGYRRVDAGRTGPFLNDGLQRFKRKWGLLPALDPLAHVAAVWVATSAARKIFSQQPVLVEQGTDLGTYAGEAA